MRKAILQAHLITALAAGAVMVVLSVTGCLLVFEKHIDRWFDASVTSVAHQAGAISLAKVVARATTATGGEVVSEIHLGAPDRAVMAVTKKRRRVYVDGHTGEIVGTRAGPLPSIRLRQLHKNLLAGRTGRWIVVGSTFILIFQSVSGLFLWWPLKRVTVKLGASSRRIAFDLHHSAGFFASLFICAISFTGLVRYYPEMTTKLFDHAPLPALKPKREGLRPVSGSAISIDDAVAVARKQFPGSSLVRVNLPEREGDPFIVSARYSGDESPFGLSWVNLNAHDGRVLSLQDVRFESQADRVERIDRAIHTGEIGGVPTRILAFLTCLAILIEIATGLWMWWKRTSPVRVKVILDGTGQVEAKELARAAQ